MIWIVLLDLFHLAVASTASSLDRRDTGAKSKAIAVAPSQEFKGNDGPWSTFVLQIGEPPQSVEVIASTAGYQTIAILPGGCISSDPSTCTTDRGTLFNPNSSTTWKANTVTPNSTFTLNLDTNLGYNENGLFGYDTIQMGWEGSGGPSLDQQIVAGIETKDFFLGMFGLNPRPTNFTTLSIMAPSYMSTLLDRKVIPSLSWGYTAGNQYRSGSVLGSLTLGGYDAGRFVPNHLSFEFSTVDENDLVVMIRNISVHGISRNGPKADLLTQGYKADIAALIDSTTPYLWLPMNICEAFEEAFDLAWNDTVQAYLVNNTLHETLQARNANVSFTLGNLSDKETIDITLPYGAFDLHATYPLPDSRYFPLMRATNQSQYTLGRTFLQEAYLIADYGRRTFSVHQSQWPAKPEKIVEISSTSSQALSGGAIAGAVIGGVSGLVTLVVIILVIKKKSKQMTIAKREAEMNELDAMDSTPSGAPYDQKTGAYEIDGEDYPGPEIDGTKLPGHEIDGRQRHGHELADSVRRQELDGSEDVKHEMPA